MRINSVYPYFNFGTSLRFLQDVKEGYLVHGEGHVKDVLDRFFSYLSELNLQVTLRASVDLRKIQVTLIQTAADGRLTVEQANTLSSAIAQIRHTLEAELMGFEVFILTPKRIDVKKLLSNIPDLFAPRTFNKLPDVARYDLIEAGTCIAYECPTAAAFHLMRAAEAVLRKFYFVHVQRNRTAQLWGPIVQDLQNKRKFRGNAEYSALFANLDNIRLSYRNPTQHPEKIYDIQEVQDLWGLCVDVINRMSRDFPEPTPLYLPTPPKL